jgi:hypothetical protein
LQPRGEVAADAGTTRKVSSKNKKKKMKKTMMMTVQPRVELGMESRLTAMVVLAGTVVRRKGTVAVGKLVDLSR